MCTSSDACASVCRQQSVVTQANIDIYLHGGEAQPGELKAGTAVQLDNPQQDQGQPKKGHHSGPQPQLQEQRSGGFSPFFYFSFSVLVFSSLFWVFLSVQADQCTTTSKCFAQEAVTPSYGCMRSAHCRAAPTSRLQCMHQASVLH